MNEASEFFGTVGAAGLILLLLVSALKNKAGDYVLMIFMVLLEGQFSLSHLTFDVMANQTWGTEELRRFVCGVVAYTPGVLGIRLLYRWMQDLGTEEVQNEPQGGVRVDGVSPCVQTPAATSGEG